MIASRREGIKTDNNNTKLLVAPPADFYKTSTLKTLEALNPTVLQEEKLDEPFVVVKEIFPIANRPKSDFLFTTTQTTDTAHIVSQAYDKKDLNKKIFYKEAPDIISCLEPVAARFYRAIVPSKVPLYFAVYNEENKHIGVASEAIPNFIPLAKDSLSALDFNISFIKERKLERKVLDTLDAKYAKFEQETSKKEIELQKELKKIKESIARNKEAKKQF